MNGAFHRNAAGLFLAAALTAVLSMSAAGAASRREAVIPPGTRVLRNLEYVEGGHERNRLDLYVPRTNSATLPVILWVHGGGWRGGDKKNCPAIPFVAKGYAVASMNYRFSQHAVFPAQIQDCKAAVCWLKGNGSKYNLDPNRIAAWGSSAGGHLVALLGTTAGVKELEPAGGSGGCDSSVRAVIDWFGPADFLTVGAKDTRSELLGGDPQILREKAIQASPVHHVSGRSVPFLIMHGDKDTTVPLSQSKELANALEKAGVECTFLVVKGAGHGGAAFSSAENMGHIEEFLRKELQTGSQAGMQRPAGR